MATLQELLDEWIVAAWQNRPHDSLRDPLSPGRAFTPNEKYAALVEAAGYVPVALSGDDYIELLPARWQAINADGVQINYRTYDSAALNPIRRQRSGIKEKKGLWEIHHDPYDVSRIWIRNHHTGAWLQAVWKHLHRVPTPFGELAWEHARRELPDGTEEQIADAVSALLTRANAGPVDGGVAPSRRAQRVAARTHATNTQRTSTTHQLPAPPADEQAASDGVEEDAAMATVIPLPVFDPFAEARKRR